MLICIQNILSANYYVIECMNTIDMTYKQFMVNSLIFNLASQAYAAEAKKRKSLTQETISFKV